MEIQLYVLKVMKYAIFHTTVCFLWSVFYLFCVNIFFSNQWLFYFVEV